MIFKINPSFVLPRCLPARSLGCLSVCLFIVPIWSRINFTPLFVPFAVGVGGKRRGVKRDRQREGRKLVGEMDWKRGEWFDSGRRGATVRLFVFAGVPWGFHFESSITVGDQSQLNSSGEDAARWKKTKKQPKQKSETEDAMRSQRERGADCPILDLEYQISLHVRNNVHTTRQIRSNEIISRQVVLNTILHFRVKEMDLEFIILLSLLHKHIPSFKTVWHKPDRIARRADRIICIADKNTHKIATWICRPVTPTLSSDARRKSDGEPEGWGFAGLVGFEPGGGEGGGGSGRSVNAFWCYPTRDPKDNAQTKG